MALTSGARLGPYEILAPLGQGGMGEVYRARDTKLNRDVALKVLPDSFAHDPDRLARFQREAHVLASLNHPHIAAIYGIEEANGVRALVLELVEGPTLADRIAQGPIPPAEALPIAKQIAEALEAAHEQGIMHRDLKPANIKVREDGTVKVLDFGLAKALDPTPASDLSRSPTITSPAATRMGVILGTAAYMAPEQAKGRVADKRSDVWAFGCVLYEMLTGKRAFEGEDVGDTLAAVLRGEPDWSALPASVPASIRRLIKRCLEKDRRQRIADLSVAQFVLDEPAMDGPVVPTAARRGERLAWVAALVVLAAVAVTLAVPYFRAPADAPEMRTEIRTPATSEPASFALSPDGRRLVFVASGDGPLRLWLRPLEAATAQPLAGTEGAAYPFWSPDSRSVGFFAGGQLKRVDIGGGLPQTLANVANGRGGTWSADGVILFAPNNSGPLLRMPASGGEAVAVTKVDPPRQIGHRFPQFLPGGRQFLFYATGSVDGQGIYIGSLDAPDTTRLTAADTAGLYAPTGWLLFVRQGTLVARRFDPVRGALTGDPVTVADPVSVDAVILGNGAFSVSATGLVSYRAAGAGQRQLAWFDRSGKALGTLGALDENNLLNPGLSPDGRRVAVDRVVQGNTDIWLLDAARTTRFTFDPSSDAFPVWSPDGSRIVFRSDRKVRGVNDLYQKPSNGAGSEELLVESPQDKHVTDWSADGRFLLYRSTDPKATYDLWVLPLEGDRKPRVFLQTAFDERQGQFSPDGRWVAYRSNESGRVEIYVRPFAGPGGQWQVSTAGGTAPRWRRDGKELYYIAPDGRLMAVPIAAPGATLEPGTPVPLFQTRIVSGTGNDIRQQYAVAPDGRFLINVTTEDAAAAPITLLLNWKPKS